MIKDTELSKLKEDNKLLAKQFREKKEAQKKRQQFLQVVSSFILTHSNVINSNIYIGTIKTTRVTWEWSIWKCK